MFVSNVLSVPSISGSSVALIEVLECINSTGYSWIIKL